VLTELLAKFPTYSLQSQQDATAVISETEKLLRCVDVVEENEDIH
jgi:hypothetical protein